MEWIVRDFPTEKDLLQRVSIISQTSVYSFTKHFSFSSDTETINKMHQSAQLPLFQYAVAIGPLPSVQVK